MAYIEITNLSKTIKGIEVLKGINLSLERGNIYGFFGRNGSGKTMLFRAIAGLIIPTEGEVKVASKLIGKDVSFPPSIGLTIENVGFWRQYTGFDNLKLLASINNIADKDDIRKSMLRIGLNPDDKRKYKAYSLGMKQKLAIAQALMDTPELIILDEPTNSLDQEAIHMIRNILAEEKSRGAAILICSHNKDDINMLSDEKFMLENGICSSFKEEWK